MVMKEKDFYLQVTLKFDNLIPAETLEEAIEILKESFKEEYRLDITDKEITVMDIQEGK